LHFLVQFESRGDDGFLVVLWVWFQPADGFGRQCEEFRWGEDVGGHGREGGIREGEDEDFGVVVTVVGVAAPA
jgi:hypothetical protein